MTVNISHVGAAEAILGRIAMSGGEDVEPEARLAMWRAADGIAPGTIEQAAAESAAETVTEIERIIEEDGGFSLQQFRECLEREFMHAWQVGWVMRARRDAKRGDTVG